MSSFVLLACATAIGQTCLGQKCPSAQESHAVAVVRTVSCSAVLLPNLVETAVAAGKFKTLVAALLAADLAEPLRDGTRKFTVFAPSDEAFGKLDPALVQKLLKPENKATLAAILKYHVVAGEVPSAAVATGKVKSLGGAELDLVKDGHGVAVNGARVTMADVHASNGVIHVIDSVLMPPNKAKAGDIVAVARKAGGFTILLKALEATKLDDALRNPEGKFTVFAPNDAAFRKLGNAKIQELLAQPEALANILKFHVVAGAAVNSKDFLKAGMATTLQGGQVLADLQDARLTVNGAKVLAADVKASNGVIHVIDTVLLP